MVRQIRFAPWCLRVFVFSFLVLSLTTFAQDEATTWQAWLYDPSSGDLTLVDGFGFIRGQAKIELPQGYPFYPYDLAIAPSGQRIAYIVSQSGQSELLVYNPRPGIREVILRYELPSLYTDGLNFISTDTQLFNPAESALAVGYSLAAGGWQIPIVDIASGLATSMLRNGAGLAADLPSEIGVTPVVRQFDGRVVVFTLVQAAALGQPNAEQGSYRWDTQNNTLTPTEAYLALDVDTFAPTGEVVQALYRDDGVRLAVYTPLQDAAATLYSLTDERPFFPRFVQNGAAVLFGAYNAEGKPTYRLIGRDGALYAEWAAGAQVLIGSLYGTADGFAYTVDKLNADDTSGTTLYGVNMFENLDAGKALFTATVNTRPRIVWLQDPRLTTAPFTPWIFEGETASATPLPVTSAATEWQAWIYQDDGIAVRVNQAGTPLDTDILPFAETAPKPTRVSASADGNLFAYVADSVLYVYDTRRDQVLLEHPLPKTAGVVVAHTIERAPHVNLFGERNTRLAFGYSNGTGWQIDVLALPAGEVAATLTHDSSAMQALNTAVANGVVPIIQKFTDGKVHFTIQAGGTLQPPYPSFVWDTIANTVNPTLTYANPFTATFVPTGEVIMAMIDPRLPNTADRFLYGQLNALHVYDPVTNSRYPFYNSEELWLQRPFFIQNGERILSGGVDPAGAFIGWVVVERDGTQVGLLPFAEDVIDAAGTGNGFMYIPRTEQDVILRSVNTREKLDVGVDVWRIARTGRPQIVWADYPVQSVEYPPWRVLAVPINVGAAASNSTAQLQVGGTATIRTIGGDALYVRATPGRDAPILTRLNSGTRVTLVEGAVTVNGELWWRIQTQGGVQGWVIEFAEGIRTLTPEEN